MGKQQSAKQFRRTADWKRMNDKFKKDPILFARSMFPRLTDLPSPDFHYELSRLYLDKNEDKVVAISPRDHGKTALAQIFAIHHILFDEGEKFILFISKTQSHAIRMLRGVKIMMSESKFQYMYGHLIGREELADKWNEKEVIMRTRNNQWAITAKGMGIQVRGLREGYSRITLCILDDPEDENNTKTAESMEANYEYAINGLVPALSHRGGKIWVIGTPLHQRSMVMRLRNRIDWTARKYSAEHDKENEVSLWPEKFSWDKLMEMRRAAEADGKLSSYIQEYCCRIISDSKRLFQERYMRYYEGDVRQEGKYSFLKYRELDQYGDPISEWQDEPVAIYTGVDVAVSTRETADYFVIFHTAVTPNNDRFVLPYFRDRVTPSAAIEQIIAEYKKFNPIRVSIETSGQQDIMRDVLRNRDDIYIPGLSVKHNPKDKKEKRHLEMLEPWLSKRKVFVQRNMKELLDEMRMHPKGRNDDTLDGMYYSFLHAKPPSGSAKTIQQRLNNKSLSSRISNSDQAWMLG